MSSISSCSITDMKQNQTTCFLKQVQFINRGGGQGGGRRKGAKWDSQSGGNRKKRRKNSQCCVTFHNRNRTKGENPYGRGREPGVKGTGGGSYRPPCLPPINPYWSPEIYISLTAKCANGVMTETIKPEWRKF